MTFSMMWIHGDAILAAGDAVLTYPGRTGVSGNTAFGWKDILPGRLVREGAMKVAQLRDDVVVAFAGDLGRVNSAFEVLDGTLRGGATGRQAMMSVSRSLSSAPGVDLLLGTFEDGSPVIVEWSSGLPAKVHDTPIAAVIGSLPDQLRLNLCRSATSADPRSDPQKALYALQVAAHIAFASEPGLFALGSGGALSSVILGRAGVTYPPRTIWMFADESQVDGLMGAPGHCAEGIGYVVSVVGNNVHYVSSSYYTPPFSSAVFIGIPNGMSDPEIHAWADVAASAWEQPDVVIVVNLRLRCAVILAMAEGPGPALHFESDADGRSVAMNEEWGPVVRRRIAEGSPPGVRVHLARWGQGAPGDGANGKAGEAPLVTSGRLAENGRGEE